MMGDDIGYLNSTVYCRIGVSPIHGVGVFAIRDIPKGTPFTDYNIYHHKVEHRLFVMHKENFNELHPEVKALILDQTIFPKEMDVFEFYSPNHQVCLQSLLNHSRTPNTDGHVAIVDIKAGEELTEDYNTLYDEGLSEVNITNFNSTNI